MVCTSIHEHCTCIYMYMYVQEETHTICIGHCCHIRKLMENACGYNVVYTCTLTVYTMALCVCVYGYFEGVIYIQCLCISTVYIEAH